MAHANPSSPFSVSLFLWQRRSLLSLAPPWGMYTSDRLLLHWVEGPGSKGVKPSSLGCGLRQGKLWEVCSPAQLGRFLLGDGISEKWFSQRRGLLTYPQRVALRTLLRPTAAAKGQLKIWILGIFKTLFSCIYSLQ